MSALQQISRPARGFALMMAIFMIITLAAIGAYLLTISTGQLEAATQDEQGMRAYQAARTGADWGAHQILCNPANAQCTRPASAFLTACDGGAASQTLPLGVMGGPAGAVTYSSLVECTKIGNEIEGGITVNVYQLKVTGCNILACSPRARPQPTLSGNCC